MPAITVSTDKEEILREAMRFHRGGSHEMERLRRAAAMNAVLRNGDVVFSARRIWRALRTREFDRRLRASANEEAAK